MTAPTGGPGRPGASPDRSWQRWAVASSLVEALADEDWGVDDLVALTGAYTPGWVHRLPAPAHWQRLDFPDAESVVAPARVLVWGPRGGGGWEATDTLQVYGYTGIPSFGDVLGSTARSLDDLDAHDMRTGLLAMPSVPGVAAERSTAVLTVAGRRILTQLTNYVAASTTPHAGRLIVHSLSVAAGHPELAEDLTALTRSVQEAFTALVAAEARGVG
ncbi:hypothetical protein [Mycolicibacterium aromaticivorans]|uniref:hypothetical protein n=1 Tax=Mycolicibacterium aromaticivorans TaxID=318425 RepID=UPI00103BBD3F|nr:hypothetical protein [Mycolicibacterium aromaticivorans]